MVIFLQTFDKLVEVGFPEAAMLGEVRVLQISSVGGVVAAVVISVMVIEVGIVTVVAVIIDELLQVAVGVGQACQLVHVVVGGIGARQRPGGIGLKVGEVVHVHL